MTLYEHKQHKHQTKNLNDLHEEGLTIGQKIADSVANSMGSWAFIITQTVIVAIWIILNVWILSHPFDPYPLILLNLVFSTQAAYASPLILMSQNRQAEKDRLKADEDYKINVKAEEETRQLIEHLYEQDNKILEIANKIDKEDQELLKQTNMLIELLQSAKNNFQS